MSPQQKTVNQHRHFGCKRCATLRHSNAINELRDPGERGSFTHEFRAAFLPLSSLDPQLVARVETTHDGAALPARLARVHVLQRQLGLIFCLL